MSSPKRSVHVHSARHGRPQRRSRPAHLPSAPKSSAHPPENPKLLATAKVAPNPYLVHNGTPTLRKSIVAFVDMLGYKDTVIAAKMQGTSAQLLAKLHKTLRLAFLHLNDRYDDGTPVLEMPPTVEEPYAIRAFTDNVVIGYPVHDDAEFEFGLIFSQLARFQLEMSSKGFFMRGAISFGDLYMDDITVFGDGLVDAFEGESKYARDPRIILTESAKRLVKYHLTYYADPKESPQAAEVYKDADDRYFLNYLESTGNGENFSESAIMEHKCAVEKKLKEFRDRPEIWAKYAWVASYHNFFCQQYRCFAPRHRIDPSEFTMQPRRIV